MSKPKGRWAKRRAACIWSCEVADVAALPDPPEEKLIYLTQTTLSIDETAEIVDALRARFPRLEDPPTGDICYATQNRQDAIKVIAPRSDVVLVIGSQTSSNTKSLRQVAESLGARAYLIGGREDITDAMLAGRTLSASPAGPAPPKTASRASWTNCVCGASPRWKRSKCARRTWSSPLPAR